MKDTVITTALNYTALGKDVATSARPTNDLQYLVFMVALSVVAIAGLAVYMYLRDRQQTKKVKADDIKSESAKCVSCPEINSIRPLLAQILQNQEESRKEKRETRQEFNSTIAEIRTELRTEMSDMTKKIDKGLGDVHNKVDAHTAWHLKNQNSYAHS